MAARTVRGTDRGLRAAWLLSTAVVVLAVAAAAGGLWIDGFYQDPAVVGASFRGNDLATLVVGAPVLAVATLLASRGSARAQLVWLGMLAYFVYNYAFYIFGAEFNDLFLVHVALFVASASAFVLGIVNVDAAAAGSRFHPRTPARWIGGLLLLLAASLVGMWGFASLRFAVSGEVPVDVLPLPAWRVHLAYALDLALLVPGLALAGVLLWRRRAWGYVLGTAMCVCVTVYQVNFVSQTYFVADVPGVDIAAVDYLELGVVAALLLATGLLVACLRRLDRPAIPLGAGGAGPRVQGAVRGRAP